MDTSQANVTPNLDPALDADLVRWRSDDGPPRIRLLGPVAVEQTAEAPPPARTAACTELAVYLACHPEGVTRAELSRAVSPRTRRDVVQLTALSQVRRWLGTSHQHTPYLPPLEGSGSRYRLDGVLVDADLFQRLQLRGLARGEDGIEDLWTALRLVTGEPFSQQPPQGYAWLVEDRLDLLYAAMVDEVAHTIAKHHLAGGESEQAIVAAELGLQAVSHDLLLLDLVNAYNLQDRPVRAHEVIARLLDSHEASTEEDLPSATYRLLRSRQAPRRTPQRRLWTWLGRLIRRIP